ncbi:U3 small nucleolar RNA-associated protein 11 [Trichodelitschia bisporula]|uniref:U3 small nucleolar RNA-associated protein 11 n=1 Tax=Trichodelitschia bisporula TaxID=703511 RepID=A0A6G1I0I6_9PEZI|nr:U3 small nucleolar RNA-associated protein 11 [Trichodelitschia bisporula]
MSSMRNAVQRRNHKERAQPLEREKWGLLEKHKDYSLRAKDHREKKQRLKALKEKASFRNPDEFHFGMMSTRTSKGQRLGDRGNKALSQDIVRLLKTQDAGYIRTKLQETRKEIERLEQEFQVEEADDKSVKVGAVKGGPSKGKHTVFVETVEEQREFDPKAWFGQGDPMPTAEAPDKPKTKQQEEAAKLAWKESRKHDKKRERNHSARRQLLASLRDREEQLQTAEEQLEQQRARMNKGVGGVNKNGVKFKIRERKR